jgi:hypothetical protein
LGETQSTCSGFEFNRSVRAEASSDRLSADGGALLVREALHRLGLDSWLSDRLADPRDPDRVTHPFEELLRTLLLLQVQGWSDLQDVDALRDDPVFRTAVSSRRQDRAVKPAREAREPDGLPSQPTLSRLLRTLSSEANREVLGEALREGADRRHRLRTGRPLAEATIDLDSLPLNVHGHQPGTAFNPHYGTRCYHPLLVRWSPGDVLGARLRPGNAHTADGGLTFALPVLRWAKRRARRLWLRADAGFPEPAFLQGVEEEGIRYVARLRTNERLKRMAEPHVTRPPGRPPEEPREWLHEMEYAAHSWDRTRRVVLVVLERPQTECAEDGTVQTRMFLEHFFLLTNAPREQVPARELLERYRGRGRAEKDFGDWKTALRPRLSSSPRPKSHYRGESVAGTEARRDSFAVNEAWLMSSLLAANLLDWLRSLWARISGQRYERRRFRRTILRAAVRVTLGGRRIRVHAADRHVRTWKAILERLGDVRPARGSPDSLARPLPA